MNITTFALGPLGTNCYLLENGAEAVVFDPGGDPAPVLAALEESGATLTHILLTHVHFDHLYGCRTLAEATGAPVLLPQGDEYLLQTEIGMGGLMGLPVAEPFEHQLIGPGAYAFAGLSCKVFNTPGHSPGSLIYYFEEAGAAFVGDLIFHRSVGRSDFPGGDHDTLINSVRENVFTLPDNTVLYPGHMQATTVADEKTHNPFFGGF